MCFLCCVGVFWKFLCGSYVLLCGLCSFVVLLCFLVLVDQISVGVCVGGG